MALALEGVRVLEMARVAPHFFCTMMLSDMGADVLKIDTPPTAESSREGEPPSGEWMTRQDTYAFLNRNKRSIALNLKSQAGKEIFYRLARGADVVVEGFRPGVVKRLGVDYETLSQLNPRIVYCSISGYGQDGPYRLLPGHDANYISIGGVLGLIGERGRRPVLPLNLVADYAGGTLHSVIGILMALLARERTGRGQYIDISMTDTVVSLISPEIGRYFATGSPPRRGEGFLSGSSPSYGVYETKDGKWISLGCLEPHFWINLCRALGREDYIPHQWARGKKREEILSFMKQTFLTRTRDEWFELLKDRDIAIGKVYDLDEIESDPQIQHRQMVVQVEDAKGRKLQQVGTPIKLSETPGRIRGLAPALGEHTDEVLRELGYGPEAIARFLHEGTVA
ncbi:MAG: CaiB/BaiF CoA transferase family protein [Dehalococcoidia bacterium]